MHRDGSIPPVTLRRTHNPGANVFISYSREDAGVARDLYERIAALGHTPWMDLLDVPAGANWSDETDEALRSAGAIVGLLSPAGLRSERARNEWDWAVANGQRLVLILVEPCEIPFHYASCDCIDFTSDQATALVGLAQALAAATAASARPSAEPEAKPGSQSPSPPTPPRVSPPVLVGRDEELSLLRGYARTAAHGQGSSILLAGEAGIGKTTLCAAVEIDAADSGMLVLTGSCYDLTTTPPYGPWAEIARAYPEESGLPPLPEAFREGGGGLEAIDSQRALFDLVTRFLATVAEKRPLFLVLEDLHWADQASMELLRHLSRVLPGRILILATYRDDELTREHPLSTLLPALVREGRVHRIALQRLNPEAVQELVRERYRLSPDDEERLTSYLGRLAEGNPFFINELLHTLDEQQLLTPTPGGWVVGDLDAAAVPALVQQVIDRRLSRLDRSTRELLDPVAVIGFEIPLELLQSLYSGSPGELDAALGQAIEHHLLFLTPGRRALHFSHALVRQTIYEQIPPLRRQYLHLDIGRLRAGRPYANPNVVANHLYRAGDERAIDWLIRAAEGAQAVYAPQTVLIQCRRAIDLAEQHGLQAPVVAFRLRGLARESVGDFDGALADHEMALRLAREIVDRRAEWKALLDLAMLWASRDYDQMGDYCRQAVEQARMMNDRAALGHSLNRLGNWYMNIEKPSEGLQYHEEALLIFEELEDQMGTAATLDLIANTYHLVGDADMALRYGEQAVVMCRRLGDRPALTTSLEVAANTSGAQSHERILRVQNVRQFTGADPGELYAEGLKIAQETGRISDEAVALGNYARWKACIGSFQQALDLGMRAGEIAEDIQHHQWTAFTRFMLGVTYGDLFATKQAISLLERALQLGRLINSAVWIRLPTALLASVCVLDGQYDRARRLLDELVDTRAAPDTAHLRLCWFAYAELQLAEKQPELALEVIEMLIDSIPGERGVFPPALARLHGEALLGLGRLDEAEATLLSARDGALQIGYPKHVWQSWASLRRLHLEQGRLDEAEEAREAALAIIDELAADLEDDELRENFLRRARAQLPGNLPFTANRALAG